VESKPGKPRDHTGPDLTYGGLDPYSSWKQVAAYFDGDGSVSTRIRAFTLTFSLEFSESYLPQLEQVRDFLALEGVSTPPIATQRRLSGRATNYVLKIHAVHEVRLICKRMLPFAFKKEWDLRTALDYLEERITGGEAVRRLNVSINSGRREGCLRNVKMPFTKAEGIRISAQIGGRRSSAKRARLSQDQVELLRRIREVSGKSYAELSRLFKVSSDVVRTALGKK
jgi:hypothetical protein